MVYTRRQVKDISYKIPCPFCVYSTKHITSLYNHLNKCEEYEGHIDDVESENYFEDMTIGNLIEIHKTKIELTKEFIKTNELEQIQNQTSEQIREYIQNKLKQKIMYQGDIILDCFEIYEFFFSLTLEDVQIKDEHFKNKVLASLSDFI
jgi:hypothetical protein